MSPIRKKTAEHMVLSKRISAHVSTVFEIDFSRIDQLRHKHKASFEERGVRLTYVPFVLKAVVDEHGSVSGLVTLEDLLEQIVGEIQDEYDWEERAVEKMRDGSLVVEGTLPAADLREAHQVPLPEGEFETVAGFMLEQLGSVPKGGEVVSLPGWRYTIVDVEKNRISKVKIERFPPIPATVVVPTEPSQPLSKSSSTTRR